MTSDRAFTAMMVAGEVNVLRRLHGMLENDPITSREQFRDLMTAAFLHGRLEVKALSDDLGYSLSNVYRWIDGRIAPHPSLWPSIVKWVMAAIEAKIAAYEDVEGRVPETV